MTTRWVLFAWASLAVAAGATFALAGTDSATTSAGGIPSFSCPLHPDVAGARTNTCDLCGAALWPRDDLFQGSHQPRHGGILTRAGNYHIELVQRERDFDVYVYDAEAKPVPVADWRGTIAFEEPPDAVQPLAWTSVAGERLTARLPAGPEPSEAMVNLESGKEELAMFFPLRIKLTGTVVDLACFLKHGSKALDRDHDECAKSCLAMGKPVGVLGEDDPHAPLFLVTLRAGDTSAKAANAKLLEVVNREVRVSGKIVQRGRLGIVELLALQPASGEPPPK